MRTFEFSLVFVLLIAAGLIWYVDKLNDLFKI